VTFLNSDPISEHLQDSGFEPVAEVAPSVEVNDLEQTNTDFRSMGMESLRQNDNAFQETEAKVTVENSKEAYIEDLKENSLTDEGERSYVIAAYPDGKTLFEQTATTSVGYVAAGSGVNVGKHVANGASTIYDGHTHDLESVKKQVDVNGEVEGWLTSKEVQQIREGKKAPVPTGPSPTDFMSDINKQQTYPNVDYHSSMVEPAGEWNYQATDEFLEKPFEDQLKIIHGGIQYREEMIEAHRSGSPDADSATQNYINYHRENGIDINYKP
jgi:hypothetical protein